MSKELRDLARAFKPLGVTVELTRGGHVAFIMPSGRKVFTASTPSDRRAIHNARSMIRRSLRTEGIAA